MTAEEKQNFINKINELKTYFPVWYSTYTPTDIIAGMKEMRDKNWISKEDIIKLINEL